MTRVNPFMGKLADADRYESDDTAIRTTKQAPMNHAERVLHQPAPKQMLEVLRTGRRLMVKEKPGYVSVLASVRISLDEIGGQVEVVTRVPQDPRENVKLPAVTSARLDRSL